MKKIINILVLVVIVVGVIYFWQSKYPPGQRAVQNDVAAEIAQEVRSKQAEAPKVTINVEFVFSPERSETVAYELPAAASYSLFALTKNISSQKNWSFEWKDYGEMGILITKIDQSTNGTDNNYWQYYINNKMPQVAANNYFPKISDQIRWVFQPSQY